MSSFDSGLREVHPKTRAGWRSWLQRNHANSDGVWLIYYRASTGRRRLSWEDAVREALCFGWIDSKVKPIDDERYKQIFTPRKPRSVWSKVNKQHIADLIEAGLMTDAGLRAVDVAKKNGAWSLLEPVDALIVPPELEAALRRSKPAREAYEALSKPAKRSVLYSLYSAKREDTRAKRLAKAIAELEGGESPVAD
ncbi:MAG: YdeI/OmpD-associated family protein [Acidimicrobiia bacterium]